ncbi:Undecaprenyldiphospho-muramoylpentapeptide beta-N-acetylglucosaminyltransferase [Saliniradius amylolyticus]|uniref:UDP-N-acetylglucosamine--N-acetylmuramyl-(pentapeptide) pyrophosphoryl-undecaprenol N-acetylglucosamine transferase n=1 Tax=Saliniradius amylolyticus TaxID=2183582 RepID=A0A2S2E5V9_9ALTE|nr:undecaprenyldiphospho-muramoylpentapeptide beta-N-acetylglucosaminyltransferase [Saliniradius amylolyticus]AWL12922.1 Undecaprenyldiphospho-muramoylpentapeptide beta-N-acetylglucosaminyltransferase [Saliniradius amylolyticus]
MSKRLLIMAGGTGGHVFPGLAVADYLAAEGWEIQWLGTAEKMEAQVVPDAGYRIHFLAISGIRKNGLLRLLAAPFKILAAIFQARKVIKTFRPHLVLGMGGFASGPGGIAAWLTSVPLIIHEQNALPGFTNKVLHRLAAKTLTGFDHTFDEGKATWVGNPVRQGFIEAQKAEAIHQPVRVLVVGGSLGAQALNRNLPAILAQSPALEVHHQCGKGNRAEVEAQYQTAGTQHSVTVSEFIQDMPQAYEWADLVICRAGALTVSEIACVGVAAVFVPLPHAVDDHQTKNAQALVQAGAARLVPQPQLQTEQGKHIIMQLIGEPALLGEMAEHARALARPDATEQVAHYCKQQVEKTL